MKSNQNHPPKWADKFLEWYCHPDLLEEIQGDVYELFDRRVQDKGEKAARRHFTWDVLRSFRLSTIRNFNLKISPMLFKSNFKIAFRQLAKQKMYSAIKIGGFALSIAACLLIALFIVDEISYDQHYQDKDQIYRVLGIYKDKGRTGKGVHFPAPFAKALQEDYPEVESVGRFNSSELFGAGDREVRPEGSTQNTYEEGFVFIDQDLLEILEISMVLGDPKKALAEPNSIVISKRKADKYFPNENPVGKRLILDNIEDEPFIISGVMADFPTTSHIQFDFLMTMSGVEFWPGEQTFWRANNYHTYVRLHPEADVLSLQKKMMDIPRKYLIPSMKEAGDVDADQILDKMAFELQPIEDVHLHSEEVHDGLSHGDIRFVWLFGAIALFILLIACINFINLSTAKSANRAKEVGLRKVVGSYRRQLIGQFLTESVLFSGISFLLGMYLAWMALPYFNQLAGKSLVFPWQEWWLFPVLLSSAIIIGIVAGLYPSFYLSAFKPIEVLKGQLSRGSKSAGMRNVLVIFQFTTSIVLIIGTFIIYQQMHYILNKKVGFEKEQVVLLHGANTLGNKMETFKKELVSLPEVTSATVSDYLPITGTKRNGNGFWKEGKTQEEASVPGQMWRVDHDYIKTMGMTIVEGRDFSIDMASDSQAVIINQTLAKDLGLEDPIGKRITNSGFISEVIGVVEDFHFESMQENIRGLCMAIGNRPALVSIKVNASDMSGFIQHATNVWDKFSPHQPIRYTFLDEDFSIMYANVQRMGSIFTSFAILAIIIACLGLFALSAFMAEQRRKEISIRKVLGASVNNLLGLLTKNFMALIFISLVIAMPLAWYLMQKWLNDFAYRIDMTWDVFALAGLTAMVIALLTIGYQAIRTATSNPADYLRNE